MYRNVLTLVIDTPEGVDPTEVVLDMMQCYRDSHRAQGVKFEVRTLEMLDTPIDGT